MIDLTGRSGGGRENIDRTRGSHGVRCETRSRPKEKSNSPVRTSWSRIVQVTMHPFWSLHRTIHNYRLLPLPLALKPNNVPSI
jgi:hypothetical protein